jgi:hypothetical protein
MEQNENSSLYRILNQPWIAGIEGQKLHPTFANRILETCAGLPVQVADLSANSDSWINDATRRFSSAPSFPFAEKFAFVGAQHP